MRRDDAKKASPCAVTQRPRRLLQRRIEATQRGGHRQIDERIIGAGDHQQRPAEVLQPVAERDPGVARDERRNRQGRDGKNTPNLPAWKIRPLDQPRRRRSDDGASRGGGDNQSNRVDQQLANERTHEQINGAPRAQTGRLNDCDEDRQQNERGGEQSRADQGGGRAPPYVLACACGPRPKARAATFRLTTCDIRSGLPRSEVWRRRGRRRAA